MSAMMDAQRELAQRLLAEMDDPTPLKPEVADKAAAFRARYDEPGDEPGSRQYSPRKAVACDDITQVEEDGEHLIWRGYTYLETKTGQPVPKINRPHELCGRTHFNAARAFKEEQVGHPLDEYSESVVRTCDQHLCVAPGHHEVRDA